MRSTHARRVRRFAQIFAVFLGIVAGAFLAWKQVLPRLSPRARPNDSAQDEHIGANQVPASSKDRSADRSLKPPRLVTGLRYGVEQLDRKELRELFNDDPRDEAWAPSMEQHLRRRIEGPLLEKLGLLGVEVGTVECRRQACLLEVDFPAELHRQPPYKPNFRVPVQGYTALSSIITFSGPLGDMVDNEARELEGNSSTIRETIVVAFEPERRSPSFFPGRPVDQIALPSADDGAGKGHQ
jgi:hypothetical protein